MPATTLDFMLFDIDLVDCFVAGAATCLGTLIGCAIIDHFQEKEKKDPAPIDTVADVAFTLSSIIATTTGVALAQKQMRWPAVNDNPRRLGGLFIAISVGTVSAPNCVRLMMKLFGIDYGKEFSIRHCTISAMTAAAAITRICGAPASAVFAATFSPLFAFHLAESLFVVGVFSFFSYKVMTDPKNWQTENVRLTRKRDPQ